MPAAPRKAATKLARTKKPRPLAKKTQHGTTTACGPECDKLIGKSTAGERRHKFVMILVQLESTGWKRRDRPREKAWKKAGFTAKYKADEAARLLGMDKVKNSYICHQKPLDQAVVNTKDEFQKLVTAGAMFDYTLLVEEVEIEDAIRKLVRGVVIGLQRRCEATDEERTVDLFGSGAMVSYRRGFAEPSMKRIAQLASKCSGIRMRPLEDLRKEGISQHITGFHELGGATLPVVDHRSNRKLTAQILNMIQANITIVQAEKVAGGSLIRMMGIVPEALESLAKGSSKVFVEERAHLIYDAARQDKADKASDWRELARSTTGSWEDVLEVVVGWMRFAGTLQDGPG